jgi:hypothetical protein
MAIKRLLRSTEIADSPFRSLQDVERYLDTVKQNATDEDQMLRTLERQFARSLESAAPLKFTIQRDSGSPSFKTNTSPHINAMRFDRIEVPNLEDLKKNFKIVDELSDQVEHLNTLHSQVSVSFRGVAGVNDTLKGILAMQANLKSKLDRALKFLEGIGTKYAPAPFKEVVEQVCTTLSEELKFTDYEVMGYATDENGDLHFTTYVKLINLEDDTGEFYREFYIVFTAVMSSITKEIEGQGWRKSDSNRNTVEMKYYVTVMHHFQTPGKFGKGKAFTKATEAMHHLGVMLAIENIDNSIGTLPHNLNPDRVTKDKLYGTELVSQIQVEPDALIFTFLTKTTEKEAQAATAQLYQQVKVMMQKQVPGAVVKFKLGRNVSSRQYYLKLTLSTPAKHNQLDIHGLDFLKEQFGLDDKKLRQVVNIING